MIWTFTRRHPRIVIGGALMAILVALFVVQSWGTAAVAAWFGPVMLVWFGVMAVGGTMNLIGDLRVLQAINPLYGVDFLLHHGHAGLLHAEVTGDQLAVVAQYGEIAGGRAEHFLTERFGVGPQGGIGHGIDERVHIGIAGGRPVRHAPSPHESRRATLPLAGPQAPPHEGGIMEFGFVLSTVADRFSRPRVTVTATLDCMIVYLARHPERRRAALADPELMTTAVEELLRHETPVMMVPRVMAQDYEMRGVQLRAGDGVTLVIGAADADEDMPLAAGDLLAQASADVSTHDRADRPASHQPQHGVDRVHGVFSDHVAR